MTKVILFVLILFLSISAPSAAQLSQLDFDEPAKKASGTPEATPVSSATPFPVPTSTLIPTPAASPAAKQETSELIEMSAGSENIGALDILLPGEGNDSPTLTIPVRHPIPISNKGDLVTITSSQTWPVSADAKCLEVSDKDSLLKKEKALKEILYRFTGSDIYHEKLHRQFCVTSCENPKERAFITGMLVQSDRGGTFGIEEQNEACVYKLAKPLEAKWQIFTVTKVICHCLPDLEGKVVEPTHKVSVMEDNPLEQIQEEILEAEIVIPGEFTNAPALPKQ